MKKQPEWEGLCRRCGRCCYEKEQFEGRIYYTSVPCRFLDLETLLCRVYGDRHRRRKGCAPITPSVVAMGVLPADCPYVGGQQDYLAPIIDPVDERQD